METAQMISQLISTTGFPITACVGMFYIYNKLMTELFPVLSKIEKTLDILLDEKQNGNTDE